MKKLLLSVIAFALITTSCNKYKDDFKNLNARLDALAAQIQGVSTLVAGIQATQLTIAQVTSIVNAATAPLATQAALATLSGTVTNIQNVLNTVAAGQLTMAQQITTLSTLVTNNQIAALAAIAGVQTNLTTAINNAITSINASTAAAITAAQTALQTAITNAQNNINTATANAVTAATNTLNAAITAAITSINGNTDAQVAAAITALQLAISNSEANTATNILNAQAALAVLIGNNNALLVALAAQLTLAETNLTAAIAAAQLAIITNDNNNYNVLKAIVDALTLNLAIANAQIQTLLSSNNVFIGDLLINDEATLVAAEGLGAKVRVITGNVVINTAGLNAGQMTRLNAVTDGATLPGAPPPDRIFIGTISGNLYVDGPNAVDLGSLVNVSGVSGNVELRDANHDVSALLAVKGTYMVINSDVMDDALISVGDDMTLNYCAAYIYPNLTTISGDLWTTDGACVSSVEFPVLSSVGMIDGNTPSWLWAVLVNLGKGDLTTLTTNTMVAANSTIILGENSYPSTLSITSPRATTLTMTNATQAGDLTINIGGAVPGVNPVSVVDLSNLLFTVHLPNGSINITTVNSTNSTVMLNDYWDVHDVTINGPTVQTLQSYTTGVLASGTILTYNLPVYRALTNPGTQFVLLTALQTLNIGDVRGNIVPGSFVNLVTLQNLTATSSVTTVMIDLTGITSLQTVSTAGLLNELLLSGNSSLTSVTTAGQMDRLTVDNCDALATLTNLSHVTKVLGSTGSYITVTGNAILSTLTTSSSYLRAMTITGNAFLSSFNLSSYVAGQNVTSGAIPMAIHTNRTMATFTQGVFSTATATNIVQSSLAGFKAYATALLLSGAHAGSTIDFGFRANGLGADNSAATLDADALQYSTDSGDPNPGPNSFVQRLGDAGGALGSRINVLRELGYVN